MRRMITCFLAVLLAGLLSIACAEPAADQLVLVYSPFVPRPIAVLLPGVPVQADMTAGDWISVSYPKGEVGGEMGRVKADAPIADTLNADGWLDAVVCAEETDFDSVDLNLYYGVLHQGTAVKVFGRCNGYWYVQAMDGEDLRLGCVPLDDLTLDAAAADQLNAMLPDFALSAAGVQDLYDEWGLANAELQATYGADEALWPQDVRAAFDELKWRVGFYWEQSYAWQPGEADMTAETAIAAVRRYLQQTLLIPDTDAIPLRAQYLLTEGADAPVWHVYWDMKLEMADFTVEGDASTTPDAAAVHVYMPTLRNSRESCDWPVATREAMSRAAGWLAPGEITTGDDQSIAEGMMSESAARDLAWQYAADHLGFTRQDDCTLSLYFYNTGTVMSYDWPQDEWCFTRPVFRADFYTNDLSVCLGELWYDAETGDLYRTAHESSGLG